MGHGWDNNEVKRRVNGRVLGNEKGEWTWKESAQGQEPAL